MRLYDAMGFLAAGLVITAFWMEDIVALRCVALASNIAFLIYGTGMGLLPVWLLHVVLLPINAARLSQAVWHGRCGYFDRWRSAIGSKIITWRTEPNG